MTQPLLVRAMSGPALPGGETLRAIDAYRTASSIADAGPTRPTNTGSEQIVVLFTRRLPARVYSVAHVLNYDPVQAPRRAAFAEVLRSLYGDPVERYGDAREETARWVFDPAYRRPDLALPAGRSLLEACAERGYRNAVREVGQSETPFSAALQVSEGGNPGCGLRLRTRILTDGERVTRVFQDMVSDVLAQADAECPAQQAASAPAAAEPAPLQPPRPQIAPLVVVTAPPSVAVQPPMAAPESGNDVETALRRASMYDTGHGATQDFAAALEWYRRAAERGSVVGMFNVAVMYDAGRGVAADPTEAAFWYDRAARRGFPRAQYNLALMLEHGEGIPRDPARATELFRQAAANGIVAAQQHLAARTSSAQSGLAGQP